MGAADGETTVLVAGRTHSEKGGTLACEGDASIIGPDDPHPTFDADAVRLLLRDIFRSAGWSHEDWDEYDRVMAAERRAAVLITPRRVYTNPQA